MESQDMVFSVIFFLVSMCFVSPPTEFVSAGLTVQTLFSKFLGSENLFFIQYQIKRTTTTMIVHSLIPLVYYILLGCSSNHLRLLEPSHVTLTWGLVLLVCLSIPAAAGALAYYWSRDKWTHHPISKALGQYADSNSNWHSVASRINIEYRRMDKFTTGPHGRRVIVTDSWIMKTSTYFLHTAYQSDVHLTLVSTDEHTITEDTSTGIQFLNINVNSITPHAKPFVIRLNAVEYSDLKEKIRGPIRVAQDVVIHQTLSDRFLQVFGDHVELNERYRSPPELELDQCIGCMQKTAEIKLRKLCEAEGEGPCVACLCRPMWCLECMGKWFASRQNQQEPSTWLSSRSPCPTCRSPFCMLDVCKVI